MKIIFFSLRESNEMNDQHDHGVMNATVLTWQQRIIFIKAASIIQIDCLIPIIQHQLFTEAKQLVSTIIEFTVIFL